MTANIRSFRDLTVWQKSMTLATEVYEECHPMPDSEKYGLVSQMKRSAVSVPSNIAEGSKRGTVKDYVQFLRIANGSAAELETQLLLAEQLYPNIAFQKSKETLNEVEKKLSTMIRKLSAKT